MGGAGDVRERCGRSCRCEGKVWEELKVGGGKVYEEFEV